MSASCRNNIGRRYITGYWIIAANGFSKIQKSVKFGRRILNEKQIEFFMFDTFQPKP